MPENETPPEPAPPREPRRKWEKPRVESGPLFETQSLTCLKNENVGTEQCMMSEPKC